MPRRTRRAPERGFLIIIAKVSRMRLTAPQKQVPKERAMAKYYDYIWIDPDRNGQVSSPYPTKAEAVDNALYNALNCRRRKNFKSVPADTRIRRKLWRSLEGAGWRIVRVYKKKAERAA